MTSPPVTTAGPDTQAPEVDQSALAAYVLGLGDDALILAQRLGEWITRAPQIEEDIALGNIVLDLLGQARTLLSYAGEIEGTVTGTARDEDDLAFLRDERQFRKLEATRAERSERLAFAPIHFFQRGHAASRNQVLGRDRRGRRNRRCGF